MRRVAHLTDLHLDGGDASRQRFARVLAYLRESTVPLDAIVVTGDIIESGATDECAHVAASLAAIAPTVACPGNSDRRAAFRAVFVAEGDVAGAGDARPVNSAQTVGALTLIMLDSSVPPHYHGALDAASIDWLLATLAEVPPGNVVLLGLHHPPIELGHPLIDRLRLQEAGPLAAVVRDFPQVAAVLVGHTHAATATTFAGRPLIVAPGVHSGLHLPWETVPEGSPPLDLAVPPLLAIHLLDDERRITTYFRAVP